MQPPLAKIPLVDLRGYTPLELLFLFKRQADILAQGAMDMLGTARFLASVTDRSSRRWLERCDNPYREEIGLVARAIGRPGAYLLNTSLEWCCTSGAWSGEQGPVLRRALDWPFPRLGEFAVVAQFRGRLGDFFSVTWPGYCGVLQGLAPGRFAAALNLAPMKKRGGGLLVDWLAGRFKLVGHIALPPDHLLRRVFETARDYIAAKSMLTMTPLAVPAIFTLTGARKGEGCVIERTEDGYAVREMSGGRVCTANHFESRLKADGWRPRPIDSPGRYAQAMTVGADAPGFSWFAPPIANANTRLAMVASAATGVLKVLGTAGERPVTEEFSLAV